MRLGYIIPGARTRMVLGVFAAGLAAATQVGTAQEVLPPPRPAPEAVAPAPQPLAEDLTDELPAPRPIVQLHYLQLANRGDLMLAMNGADPVTRPVGDMLFAFPAGMFPSDGLSPAVRSFCVEPLVPMYSGLTYSFVIDPLDRPDLWGLPATDEGRATAARRAGFVRELYGRYYAETLVNPAITAPAFQTAVWEVFQEQEFPEGPVPFNLYTGTFQAAYPDEVAAPEHVRLAQTYLQGLTGDVAPFNDNAAYRGLEPVRMTAVRGADGVLGQSQLLLRAAPGGGPGGGGPAGPLALNTPGGGLGGVGPIGGPGGVGPATGFPGGGFPGGGFPFGGPGGSGSTIVGPGGSGPLTPGTDTGGSSGPGGRGPLTPGEEIPPGELPPERPPQLPPQQPPPVPAPPAAVLAAVGIGILALGRRRLFGRPGV